MIGSLKKEKCCIPASEKALSELLLRKRKIKIFDSVPSTNTALMECVRLGDTEPSLYIAVSQSAGRGRLGRSFLSDDGGIYFSFNISFPSEKIRYINNVTPAVGIAAVRALKKTCGADIRLKWVNDLIFKGKKLGGILSESVITDGAVRIVIGVGINVRKSPIEGLTSSLFESEAHEFDFSAVISGIINEFEAAVENIESVAEEYERLLVFMGEKVTVHRFDGGEDMEAVVCGVTETCELIVEETEPKTDEEGRTEGKRTVLSSAEVSVKTPEYENKNIRKTF